MVVEPGARNLDRGRETAPSARRRVAVPGGKGVFDLFLGIGFDVFCLSRAHGVALPGGQAIFSACDKGLSAETVLSTAGLRVSEKIALDPARGVEMSVWRAVREAPGATGRT